MEENIAQSSISFNDNYSINNTMIGVFKEGNGNNSNNYKSFSANFSSEIEGENIYNEEEISDILKNSDDEEDNDEDIINSIALEKNNLNDEIAEEENFERHIYRKQKNNFAFCCSYLNEKEDDLPYDINEGFTQMVDKNIKKLFNKPYYYNNEMLEILMIAEKPSLARTISHILSNGRSEKYYYDPITIHTFQGSFKGKKLFLQFPLLEDIYIRMLLKILIMMMMKKILMNYIKKKL